MAPASGNATKLAANIIEREIETIATFLSNFRRLHLGGGINQTR